MSTWDKLVGKFLIFLLLLFGIGVGITSLYFASLAGLMGKLGLIGGDLRQAVRVNELMRSVYEVGTTPSCNWWSSVHDVPRYLFSTQDRRIDLGLELGTKRVECGVIYTLRGNVERGVYTMIKGLYYERANHQEIWRLVEENTENCKLFDHDRGYGYVEAYLEASEGNVRQSVASIFEDVSRLREKVRERCIDLGVGGDLRSE